MLIYKDAIYKDSEAWEENKSKHVLVGGVYQEERVAITDGDTIPTKTSILGGQYMVPEDPASGYPAHISHFGMLKTGSTYSVFKGNFPDTTLDTRQWIDISSNSASVSVGGGMVRLQSGVSAIGSATIISRLKGRFEDGQVSVLQTDVRVGELSEGNTKIWGLRSVDGQDGVYYKVDGLGFQVSVLKAGVETAINSVNFSGDKTFIPGDTNNTYIVEYSTGRAIFYRGNAGKKILLHEFINDNESLTNTLNLPIYYKNTNTSSTTNSSMYIREASVSIWGSPDKYNEAGAKIVSDFGTQVARGFMAKYDVHIHSGRNPDIDTNTDPEDIWSLGGVYTGFNATANQTITVLSTSSEDAGVLVSSGIATDGGDHSLTDSSADFVSDGVAVGHILLNDNKSIHGIITARTATAVTTFSMIDTITSNINMNVVGDAYRIVKPATGVSGAAVLKLAHLLDSGYVEQPEKYVIMNGTNAVAVPGTYMRCNDASVQLAGSSKGNIGNITVRQTDTTANIFAYILALNNDANQSIITIPKGKTGILKHIFISIVRSNGAAGSGTITLRSRRFGEVFRGYRVFEIDTGSTLDYQFEGGDVFPEGTDIKVEVTTVSDNNTVASAMMELYLIDNE